MAKTYLNTFVGSQETMIADGIAPLLAAGISNQAGVFSPTGSNATLGTGQITYNIQRMIRGKAGATPAETGQAGNDLVSFYNTAQQVDFETISTVRGAENSIVFQVAPGEEFDFGDAAGYQKVIDLRIKSRLIEGEEKAIAKIISNGVAGIVTVDAAGIDILTEAVFEIEELVDDYKAYSESVVVFIHPRMAKAYADLEGVVYQMGTNTFAAGFKGAFQYNGTTYIPNKILNAVETTPGNVAGAIVMDQEAYLNAGLNEGVTEFDDSLAGKRFVGHRYSELDAILDPSRIKVYEMANVKSELINGGQTVIVALEKEIVSLQAEIANAEDDEVKKELGVKIKGLKAKITKAKKSK